MCTNFHASIKTEVLWFFFVLLPLTILVLMKFISNGDLFQMLAFFFFNNFLFPKHKNFLYVRKIKRKSNPQTKTEPLSNLHLAVPRQHIKLKRTYFRASFGSNCSVFEMGKWGMALLTVQNKNNIRKKI